jgi:hypothetical protein
VDTPAGNRFDTAVAGTYERREADWRMGALVYQVNPGHGHRRIAEAIAAQAMRLAVAPPNAVYPEKRELAERLLAKAPQGFTKVLFTLGGSEITYTLSLATLGLNVGDTFYFDAYSSGGGGGDGAVDALANPNISVNSWGDTYTSGGSNPIFSYTVVPAPGVIALAGVAGLLRRRRTR